MTDRITIKHLDGMCDAINRKTNSPMAPYVKDDAGKYRAQIGNHHISEGYGGVCLHRMMNEGGGVTCPLDNCHGPKRELYEKMRAYLRGLEDAARELKCTQS